MLSLLLLVAVPDASAASADTLPDGSMVFYGGGGLNTFARERWADEPRQDWHDRDRALRFRAEGYFAAGLADRLMVSAYLPLSYATAVDDPGSYPCDGQGALVASESYCDPILTVGAASLGARLRLVRSPLIVSLGMDVGGDPWNAAVRGRYTSMGDATAGIRPNLVVGRDWHPGDFGLGFVAWGEIDFKLGRSVEGSAGTFRAPADDVTGGITFNVDPPGRSSFELGGSALQRLWGLDWNDAYQAEYFPTDDRWNVLWYKDVAASFKASIAVSEQVGVHLGLQRVLVTRNGPPDTTDITLGVHRYLPPKG